MPSKSRIFLYLLFAFVAGIALRSFFQIPYGVLMTGFLIGALYSTIGFLRGIPRILFSGFFIFFLLFGIIRFDFVAHAVPDLTDIYGMHMVMRGYVAREPEKTAQTQRLKIKVEFVNGEKFMLPFYSLATVRPYPQYSIGDELALSGILEKPENFSDFDYVSYLARDNIFSTMSFPEAEKIGEGKGSTIRLLLFSVKYAFEENIDRMLPDPHAALLKGLLLGDRESLPPEFVEHLRRTGTTHIVALSGYNITLVGQFIISLLIFLTLPFRVSFWIATLGIILFVILTGASPSVVRAGIMGILVLIARREGRAYHMTNAIVFAGAVMVWQNPYILRFDAAFQLSFLATLGLVYIAPVLEQGWERMMRGERFIFSAQDKNQPIGIRKLFLETISAQLAVLPLLLYLFGGVSIVSPLANVLVLITVPYAMGTGFFAALIGFLSGTASQIAGVVTWLLLEYQIRVIDFLGSMNTVFWYFGRWAVFATLLIYSACAWMVWKQLQKRYH